MKQFILQSIRFYQRFLSLDTGLLSSFFHRLVGTSAGTVCRFTPRCSEYTYEAVVSYGILRGLYLGVIRMMRCHPFGGSGYDPVPKHPDHKRKKK